MSRTLISASLDQISAEWLTEVLSLRQADIKITEVTCRGFFGYKPNKARLQLRYNEAGDRVP